MKTITLKEAVELKKEVENYVKQNNITRHGKHFDNWLINKGFEYAHLGTYPPSVGFITSMDIEILEISSKYYLNGTYLVVGAAAMGYRKGGNLYNGYVIEIKE